ncbi:MAG: hypothetical protein GY835_18410 [bacterium]|nr:hypothetical protein [bacterium]
MIPKIPNKVASIFIVGTLTLVLIWIHAGNQLLKLPKIETTGNLQIIPAAFGLLAIAGVSALLGSVIQGIAGAMRIIFQKLSDTDRFCCFLFAHKERAEARFWAKRFRELAEVSEYQDLYEKEGGEKCVSKWPDPFPLLAPTLFFKHATEPHLSWVLQHYATYFLATDIVIVVLISLVISLVEVPGWGMKSAVAFCHVVASYALLSVALHRYLYTYNSAMRHGCLFLIEGRVGDPRGTPGTAQQAIAESRPACPLISTPSRPAAPELGD